MAYVVLAIWALVIFAGLYGLVLGIVEAIAKFFGE